MPFIDITDFSREQLQEMLARHPAHPDTGRCEGCGTFQCVHHGVALGELSRRERAAHR